MGALNPIIDAVIRKSRRFEIHRRRKCTERKIPREDRANTEFCPKSMNAKTENL